MSKRISPSDFYKLGIPVYRTDLLPFVNQEGEEIHAIRLGKELHASPQFMLELEKTPAPDGSLVEWKTRSWDEAIIEDVAELKTEIGPLSNPHASLVNSDPWHKRDGWVTPESPPETPDDE